MNFARTLFLSSLTLIACGTEGEGQQQDPPVNPPVVSQKATINVVHASPDAPAVDVYLNGQVAVKALDYRKNTGNVELTAGDYKVELRAAGAAATTNPVYSASISLAKDSRTLVVAEGRIADAAGSDTAFRLLTLPFGQKDTGSVQIRLLHGSPSAPVVDLAAGNSTLLNDVKFGSASSFAKVSADLSPKTALGVRPGDAAIDLAFVTTPDATIGRGAVLTAIAFGEINPLSPDNRFFAVSAINEESGQLIDLGVQINDKAPKASFYVVHTSPDAPAVDVVTKSGDKLASNLSYRAVSSRLEVPGGIYPVEVRASGQPTAVLSANVKLLPVLSWGLFAHGLAAPSAPADRKLALSALPVGAKDAAGASKLRVVHASPDAPAVDILAGGNALISNLPFPRATGYLNFAMGLPATTLKVRASGQPTDLFDIVIEPAVVTATKGQNVTVFATGLVGTTPPSFQALAVVESAAQPTAVLLTTKPSK
ncbi:MAG: DUF4397 domain-containing protein [Myxococcales bacterium]|nr:DUF4397 domain-containing protein [Myxococcales bacterium]